jgi:hypothetical protein
MPGRIINKAVYWFEFKLIAFYHSKETIRTLKKISSEESPLLLRPSEIFNIFSFAGLQSETDGDFAEVGVFKGVTSKVICEAKGSKALHLFDTFEGLPKVGEMDSDFKSKMFKSNYDLVVNKLKNYENVFIYKGLFPGTSEPIEKKRFSFVHLDVDIYESTRDCLEFFYPRLYKSGIIISHDYHTEGVYKAFNEFFKDREEKIIELPLSQCMIIKK